MTPPSIQTIVSTSLPTIVTDLHGTQDEYAWVPVAYLLTQTACQPLYGKLADIFGRKVSCRVPCYGNAVPLIRLITSSFFSAFDHHICLRFYGIHHGSPDLLDAGTWNLEPGLLDAGACACALARYLCEYHHLSHWLCVMWGSASESIIHSIHLLTHDIPRLWPSSPTSGIPSSKSTRTDD